MAKDGTNRGGRRVRDGAKPEALNDKLAAGRPATRLTTPAELDVFDLDAPTSATARCSQASRCQNPANTYRPSSATASRSVPDLVYRETWNWLDERGCTEFVSKRLIEQCEQAISKFGLLGKHPTTGAAIASPFVAMSQSFGKQANVYRYEIFDIVRATCTTDYSGTTPGDEVMEQLLKASS